MAAHGSVSVSGGGAVTRNRAVEQGGGVYMASETTRIDVTTSGRVEHNSAKHGGGIYAGELVKVQVAANGSVSFNTLLPTDKSGYPLYSLTGGGIAANEVHVQAGGRVVANRGGAGGGVFGLGKDNKIYISGPSSQNPFASHGLR